MLLRYDSFRHKPLTPSIVLRPPRLSILVPSRPACGPVPLQRQLPQLTLIRLPPLFILLKDELRRSRRPVPAHYTRDTQTASHDEIGAQLRHEYDARLGEELCLVCAPED